MTRRKQGGDSDGDPFFWEQPFDVTIKFGTIRELHPSSKDKSQPEVWNIITLCEMKLAGEKKTSVYTAQSVHDERLMKAYPEMVTRNREHMVQKLIGKILKDME